MLRLAESTRRCPEKLRKMSSYALFVRKISIFFFNTQIYLPLVLLIQNIYSLRGLYLTVLEPQADKQTEWAIYVGDGVFLNYSIYNINVILCFCFRQPLLAKPALDADLCFRLRSQHLQKKATVSILTVFTSCVYQGCIWNIVWHDNLNIVWHEPEYFIASVRK